MRGSANSEHPPAPGFTLVEVLIAIALVGLLTVLLFGGLRFGTRTADVAGARIDQTAEIATAQSFLMAAVQDAQALPSTVGSAQPSIDFDGEPDRMEFITRPPAYLALGGLHRLDLAVERRGDAARLTVSWHLLERGGTAVAAADLRPSVLVDKVRAVTFGYYGMLASDRVPEWHDRWAGSTYLPLLVRIAIVLGDGSRVPDIMIAPRQAPLRVGAASGTGRRPRA